MTKKNETRTPWFPGSVKPVRPGVYEREYGLNNVAFCRWNEGWYCSSLKNEIASRARKPSGNQSLPWRGLAVNPEAKE